MRSRTSSETTASVASLSAAVSLAAGPQKAGMATSSNTSANTNVNTNAKTDSRASQGHTDIPELAHFQVDARRGFLPPEPPLRRLPEYFGVWEAVLDDLQSLLLAGQLRARVAKMPLLDTARLSTRQEWQRAYVVLSFIGQAYIWGKNEDPAEILPSCIAVPWCAVCLKLELKPVVTYAAVELYNFKLLDPEGPWDLSNLGMLHTFSGGMDEAWFYLISLAIEAAGAPAVKAIVDALHAVKADNIGALTDCLRVIADCIDEMNKILPRMYEKNDAHIFFNRVRPYVNGWEKADNLPHGVLYSNVQQIPTDTPTHPLPNAQITSNGTYGKYSGASAGQSSLIHVLDVALGVHHYPTVPSSSSSSSKLTSTETPPPNIHDAMDSQQDEPQHHTDTSSWSSLSSLRLSESIQKSTDSMSSTATTTTEPSNQTKKSPTNFIHEMRHYMPGPHRRFIEAVGNSYSIREYVASHQQSLHHFSEHPHSQYQHQYQHQHQHQQYQHHSQQERETLISTFNACVNGMKAFRDKHIQMVSVYIVIQARKRTEVGNGGVQQGQGQGQVSGGDGGDRLQQRLLARGTGGTNLIPFLKQSRNETKAAHV